MGKFKRFSGFYKGFAYKSPQNGQICLFWHKIFTNVVMKNQFYQPDGAETGLNMSQSIPNIKINHQKHILDLYKWHKDHLR